MNFENLEIKFLLLFILLLESNANIILSAVLNEILLLRMFLFTYIFLISFVENGEVIKRFSGAMTMNDLIRFCDEKC
jgi:hypothetical protein